MEYFNISSIIKIMQKALNANQIATGQLLFGSFEYSESWNLPFNATDKIISDLIKLKKEIPTDVKNLLLESEIIKTVEDYFQKIISPKITTLLLNDTCEALARLLHSDISVSQNTIQDLDKIQANQGKTGYLAHCFLYALSKPNMQEELLPTTDDFPLLDEVGNECPICHSKLTKNVKGIPKRHYEIVSIFPEQLDETQRIKFQAARPPSKKLTSYDNKIALCPDHAESYLIEPEVEEYLELSALKTSYSKHYLLKQELAQIDIETEIGRVFRTLSILSSTGSLEPLSYAALKIEQKISPVYPLLKNEIQFNVLTYFRFIRDLFSEIETYDLIASEVKKAFRKLEQATYTQPEIIEHLTTWLTEQAALPPQSIVACRIIISFFVQNCEVFREISK